MSQQLQSYLSTVFKGKCSIYEMRILLHVARRCRQIYGGRRFKDFLGHKLDTGGLGVDFAVPVSDILRGSRDYKHLREAIVDMQDNWKLEFFDSDRRVWKRGAMMSSAELAEGSGLLQFSVPRWLLEYIMDFRVGGFRVYDFELAMSLRNPVSARLYLMLASITQPITYTLPQVRAFLGLEHAYPRFADFERKVLVSVERELEAKGCNGFRHEAVRKFADRKKSPVVAVRFFPIRRERVAEDKVLRSRVIEEMPAELTAYLAQQLSFSARELKGNVGTFSQFVKLPGWRDKFSEIVSRARRKNKNHGYIVSACRREVLEARKKQQ